MTNAYRDWNNRVHTIVLKQKAGVPLNESEQTDVAKGLWIWVETTGGVLVTERLAAIDEAAWEAAPQPNQPQQWPPSDN